MDNHRINCALRAMTLAALLVVCHLAQAQVTYQWKTKKGLMALVRKEKGKGDMRITNFAFDPSGNRHYKKGKHVAYEAFDFLKSGERLILVKVKTKEGWGLIDGYGNEVALCGFKDIEVCTGNGKTPNGERLYIIRMKGHDGKVGIATGHFDLANGGDFVRVGTTEPLVSDISCVYDSLLSISYYAETFAREKDCLYSTKNVEDAYAVFQYGKMGVYDGIRFVMPCVFDASSLSVSRKGAGSWTSNGWAPVRYGLNTLTYYKKDKPVFVLRRGNDLYFVDSECDWTGKNLAKAYCPVTYVPKLKAQLIGHGQYAWMDAEANTNMPAFQAFTYDFKGRRVLHGEITERPFKVFKTDNDNFRYLLNGSKYTLFNVMTNQVVFNEWYDDITVEKGETGFVHMRQDGQTKCMFFTADNSICLGMSKADLFNHSTTVDKTAGMKVCKKIDFGLVDTKKGAMVLACAFDTIFSLGHSVRDARFDELFVVRRNGHYGLADHRGMLLPPLYTGYEFCRMENAADDCVRLVHSVKGATEPFAASVYCDAKGVYDIDGYNYDIMAEEMRKLDDTRKMQKLMDGMLEVASWLDDDELKHVAYFTRGMREKDFNRYDDAVLYLQKAYDSGMERSLPFLQDAKKELAQQQAEQERKDAERREQLRQEAERREQERLLAQQEYERQQAEARRQEEARRQQESEKWQNVANALTQLGNNLQAISNQYAARRRAGQARTSTGGGASGGSSSGSYSSSGGSSASSGGGSRVSNARLVQLRNRDQDTYNRYVSKLISMYAGTSTFSASAAADYQRTMRSIRQEWEGKGFSFIRSKWESWDYRSDPPRK